MTIVYAQLTNIVMTIVYALLTNVCRVFFSYLDTEQYEEAVRDYEKVYKVDKSRGKGKRIPCFACSDETCVSVQDELLEQFSCLTILILMFKDIVFIF